MNRSWCWSMYWSSMLPLCMVAVLSAEPHGTLRYVEDSKPGTIDPVTAGDEVVGRRLITLLFEGLMTSDKEGQPVPALADGLPQPYGDTELVVKIRDDAKWPDGYAITAQDVAFSVNVYKDERSHYKNRSIYEIFKRVEAVDQKTAKFVLERPSPDAVARIRFSLMPRHMIGQPFLTKESSYARNPLGAGPFRIAKQDRSLVAMALNPYYYKKTIQLQGIEMKVQEDENGHRYLLQGGAVDLDPVIRLRDLADLREDHEKVGGLAEYDSQAWSGLAYSCRHPSLQFKEVRQALTYAFDREEALSSKYVGQGTLISGPFSQSSLAYNHDVPPFEYDPEKAKQILADAGFVDSDGDGVLEKDGKPLKLRLVLNRALPQDQKDICVDYQRQLRQVGIDVVTEWLERATYEEKVIEYHDFDITFVTWKFDDQSNIYPLFSATETVGGNNFIEYRNDIVQKYLEEFRLEPDPAKRSEIGKELHRLIADECPYTFLWTLKNYAAYTPNVKGVSTLTIHPFYFFTYIDRWYIEEE